MIQELADIRMYLAVLEEIFNVDLDDVTHAKLLEVEERPENRPSESGKS